MRACHALREVVVCIIMYLTLLRWRLIYELPQTGFLLKSHSSLTTVRPVPACDFLRWGRGLIGLSCGASRGQVVLLRSGISEAFNAVVISWPFPGTTRNWLLTSSEVFCALW